MKTNGVVPASPSLALKSLIEIAGRASSLRMVPTPWPSAIVPRRALDRLTKNVSSGSKVVSPLTSTVTVLLVSPGRKTTVPPPGT